MAARWNPITIPPSNNKDVLLYGSALNFRHDQMLRAFYEAGKWWKFNGSHRKMEASEIEIKSDELRAYKYWLEINPPLEFKNK